MIDLTEDDLEQLQDRIVTGSRFYRKEGGELDYWVHAGALQDILEVFIPPGCMVVRIEGE